VVLNCIQRLSGSGKSLGLTFNYRAVEILTHECYGVLDGVERLILIGQLIGRASLWCPARYLAFNGTVTPVERLTPYA